MSRIIFAKHAPEHGAQTTPPRAGSLRPARLAEEAQQNRLVGQVDAVVAVDVSARALLAVGVVDVVRASWLLDAVPAGTHIHGRGGTIGKLHERKHPAF